MGFLGGRGLVVDMTLGAGGHAEALLDAGVERLVGVDRDPRAIELASERLARFGDRFTPVRARFSDAELPGEVDGVLYDLGLSSMQLEEEGRGFSYRRDDPLDMRMGGPSSDEENARELVNRVSEEDLLRLLRDFGEERQARRIAHAIVRARTARPPRPIRVAQLPQGLLAATGCLLVARIEHRNERRQRVDGAEKPVPAARGVQDRGDLDADAERRDQAARSP